MVATVWLVACSSAQETAQVPVTEDPESEAVPDRSPSGPTAGASNAPNTGSDEQIHDNTPRPGATVKETRTGEAIRNVVLQHRQSVRSCYEQLQKRMPDLKGTLTLHFKLDPRGVVSFAEVNRARSTLKNPELTSCAVDALKQIRFPPSSRGFESDVNYPFDFRG
jgi:hypothetical protein